MKGITIFLFSFILFSCENHSSVGRVEFNVINKTDSIIDVIHIQNSSGNRVKLKKIEPHSIKTVYLRKSFDPSSEGVYLYGAKKGNEKIKINRIGYHYRADEDIIKDEEFFIILKNDTVEVSSRRPVLVSKDAWQNF